MLALYLFTVSCELFMNKEFTNFLSEKLDINDPLMRDSRLDITNKMGQDKLTGKRDTSGIITPGLSKLAPQEGEKKPEGGKPEDKKGGDKPGDKKEGDKPGDKKEGDNKEGEGNVSIQPIKIKDKDAVLIKTEGNDEKPKIVVLADQELMKNQEELKKLPAELGGKGGDDKKEGDQKEGGKPGEDKKEGGKPGEDKKEGGKPGEDKKGSPLVSLSPQESTKEGTTLKDKLDLMINESKDNNKNEPFWTTVMVDNEPKKVKVNVKTFTVLESISNKKIVKEESEAVTDRSIPSIFNFRKNVNEESEKEESKEKKEEAKKESKDKLESAKKDAQEKKDDTKEKKEEAKKESKDKLESAKKNAQEKKDVLTKESQDKTDALKKETRDKKDVLKKESSDKMDDLKKQKEDKEKELKNKEKEYKKEKEDDKKKEDKEKELKNKEKEYKKEKEDDKKKEKEDDKKKEKEDDKKKDDIKYETGEFDKNKKTENESIWSSIFNRGDDKPDPKRLNGGNDVKIDSKISTANIPIMTKMNEKTTIKTPEGKNKLEKEAKDKLEKNGKDKVDSIVNVGKEADKKKSEKEDKKDEKKSEKDEKKEIEKAMQKKTEKDEKKESEKAMQKKTEKEEKKDEKKSKKDEKNPEKDEKDSAANTKKALESVIFQGGNKDLKQISSKKTSSSGKDASGASMDDLLYVLKNMPGKVNINKEGKEIYIEGDFVAPKERNLEQMGYKFSGVIKSKSGKAK